LPEAWDPLFVLLRLPMALAYVLFLPGYCLTIALFPCQDDIGGHERLALSLGLSATWVPFLAYLVDKLPWGLQLWPIALGQLFAIILFAGFAIWRRSRVSVDRAYVPRRWQLIPWWSSLSEAQKRISLIALMIVSLTLLSGVWIWLVPGPADEITEFYILGEGGLAESYPREAKVGEPVSVTMGLANRERKSLTYFLQIWVVDPLSSRSQMIREAGPFAVDANQSLEEPIQWIMPWTGKDQIVYFNLYGGADPGTRQMAGTSFETPEPYRQLRLWLDVKP
jgi:uncharacterized membrane protein